MIIEVTLQQTKEKSTREKITFNSRTRHVQWTESVFSKLAAIHTSFLPLWTKNWKRYIVYLGISQISSSLLRPVVPYPRWDPTSSSPSLRSLDPSSSSRLISASEIRIRFLVVCSKESTTVGLLGCGGGRYGGEAVRTPPLNTDGGGGLGRG